MSGESSSSEGVPSLLYWFLGIQKNSVCPFSLEYLTCRDLANVARVNRHVRRELRRVEYTKCRDGQDYLVPFPGFPGVLSSAGAGLFSHQLASLEAMYKAEHRTVHFGALRGGILGDAPGLGKTITTLAMISSTAGTRVRNPPEFWDEAGMKRGWQNLRNNVLYKLDIMMLLKPIRRWTEAYLAKTSPEYKKICEHVRFVAPPYQDDRFQTIEEFERYIVRNFRNLVDAGPLEECRENLNGLKMRLDKQNRKLLKSAEGHRIIWERTLFPVSSTLIIVPNPLFEHWSTQIKRHLNLKMFSEDGVTTRGVVFLDGGIGDITELDDPHKSIQDFSMSEALPEKYELSQYLIVLTTFSRCEQIFDKEVASGRIDRVSTRSKKRHRLSAPDEQQFTSHSTNPLLQMRWLRLIVDEGHELGEHETGNAITRVINQIAAERRWVLSGTPTTGDEDEENHTASALDQIQRLLCFLRHPRYGIPLDSSPFLPGSTSNSMASKKEAKSNWVKEVKMPFLNKDYSGRDRLKKVFREIMVMHRKEDIHLPAPVFRQIEEYVEIPDESRFFDKKEEKLRVDYFEEYLKSSDFQSMVDKAQADYIVRTIREARAERKQRGAGSLTCVDLALSNLEGLERQEHDLRPIKAVIYSSDENVLLSVADQVIRQVSPDTVAELYETRHVSDISSELQRFRSGLKEYRPCPICNYKNEVAGRYSRFCHNSLLEVKRIGTDERFLVEPERIMMTHNVPIVRMRGEDMSKYRELREFWRVGDRLKVDISDVPYAPRMSEETWQGWGSDICKQLAHFDGYQGNDWYFGPFPECEETSINVELKKWQYCGNIHRSKWYTGPKLFDQPIQHEYQDTHILMLHSSLSHGLDLSFVTHIFLTEAIKDASILEQVTSRAHRLGATGPVIVDTINVFYKTSAKIEEAVSKNDLAADYSPSTKQNVENTLSKQVCIFCYREFMTKSKAEEHERFTCPRNPNNTSIFDPFHLSSVYREIKPPAAVGPSGLADDSRQ